MADPIYLTVTFPQTAANLTVALEESTITSVHELADARLINLDERVQALENDPSEGSVTSVNASGGTTGLSFSGGPITTSGTFTLSGTLGIANGGTGATTVDGARSSLGLAIGSNVQAWDADLDALSVLSGTNTIYYRSGSNTWSPVLIGSRLSFVGGTLSNSLTASEILSELLTVDGTGSGLDADKLGGVPSSEFVNVGGISGSGLTVSTQNIILGNPGSSIDTIDEINLGTGLGFSGFSIGVTGNLLAIANLSSSSNQLPYFTGSGTAALTSLTAAGRALIDDADTAAQRTTLGLVIGTNVQAWDGDLDALAGLSGTNTIYYRSGTNTWSSVSIGSNLSFSGGALNYTGPLGTVTSIDISGGATGLSFSGGPITESGSITVSGVLEVANGGTGAATAELARSNLGIEIFQTEIDFGSVPTLSKSFTVVHSGAQVGQFVLASQSGDAATGRDADENEMDGLIVSGYVSSVNTIVFFVNATDKVVGKYKINYQLL